MKIKLIMAKIMILSLTMLLIVTNSLFVIADFDAGSGGNNVIYDGDTKIKKELFFDDFNDYVGEDKPSKWSAATKGCISSVESGETYGNSGQLKADESNKATEMYLNLSTSLTTGNLYYLTATYKFSDTKHNRILMISQQNAEGNLPKVENLVLKAGGNGKFQTWSNVDLMPYEAGVWYKVDLVLDLEKQQYELYINGSKMVDKTAFSGEFRHINRFTCGKQWNGDATNPSVTIDNAGIYELMSMPTAKFVNAIKGETECADALNVPKNLDVVNLKFTSKMSNENVAGKIHLVNNSKTVATINELLEDGISYKITLKEELQPFCDYKIVFDEGIVDAGNMALSTKEILLKTASNVINTMQFTCEGKIISSPFDIKGKTIVAMATSDTASTTPVTVAVAVYKNKKFVSVTSVTKDFSTQENVEITVDIPNEDGDFSAKAFAWSGSNKMTATTNAITLKK